MTAIPPKIVKRACSPAHPDPLLTYERCPLCKLAVTDGRYQRLWGLPVTAPDGPHAAPLGPRKTIAWCANRNQWDWWVRDGVGKILDSGSEPTEERANSEANDALAEHARPAVLSLDNGGIGDALLGLAVATGLGPHISYDPPAHRREWVSLFADIADHRQIRLGDYNRHDVPRWQWWASGQGTTARLPELRPLPDHALSWAIPYAGRIVIAPFAAFQERTWPTDRWLEVEKLLINMGFGTLILDDVRNRTDAFQGEKIIGESAVRVAAVLKFAAAFAGNDSGMAHVAGFCRVPSVAVCSTASDADIFGLYPTVRQLGGRQTGYDHIGAAEVVGEIVGRVRSGLGDFPVGEFSCILHDRDRWRLEGWLPIYAALWKEVRTIGPARIVEIGTRAGYSAWTMLRGTPADVQAFDKDCDEHGGFSGAHEHARKILPAERFALTIQDSHTIDRLPACDLAYVDGDHSEAGAFTDLELCEQSGVPVILLDDVTNLEDVKRAADRFCHERDLTPKFIPSRTGLYRIDLHSSTKGPLKVH